MSDNNGGLVIVTIILSAILVLAIGIDIGMGVNETHYTTEPVKPSITITNVDGVIDTTYTYTFE